MSNTPPQVPTPSDKANAVAAKVEAELLEALYLAKYNGVNHAAAVAAVALAREVAKANAAQVEAAFNEPWSVPQSKHEAINAEYVAQIEAEAAYANTYFSTVVLIPLCDTAKLLLPTPKLFNRINGHDLGAVCKYVAASLVCSVWDLCVYQVPTFILIEGYEAAYAVFDNRTKQGIFLGYYGVMAEDFYNKE